jgi:hypothetical protein
MTLEKRYNKLDDVMKMWFKQQTLIHAWNKSADEKNQKAKEFNESKKWWQRKKSQDFPHYHETPISMPNLFPLPPSFHPQYNETKQLIEDYIDD